MAKIIGNTTATTTPRSDWNQTDETKADYIKNKPTNLASQDDIANAIDIIDVGGRNLIVDGELDKASNVWGTDTPNDISLNFDNGYLVLMKENESSGRLNYRQFSSHNPLLSNPKKNHPYTLSAEVMKLPNIDVPSGSSIEIIYKFEDGSLVRFQAMLPDELADGEWTQISGTKIYDFGVPTSVGVYIMIGKDAGGFACRNIKLEKSSLADVWAAINEIKSALNEIKGISEV